MKVVAAGTGPATGFPLTGCPCASCRAARRNGARHAPARWEILTAGGTRLALPLAQPLPAGQDRELAGLAVHRIGDPEAGAVLVLETGGTGGTGPGLLWAPASGELPADALTRVPPGSVGLAVLGPAPDGELAGCARTLGRLRAMGALSSGAPVVLAGATHDSARGGLRSLLLTSWGMIPAEDGDAWDTAEHTAGPASHLATAGPAVDLSAPLLPGRVLVIGGCASGKSQLAEDLLAAAPQVTYLATGPAADPETDPDWAARVRRHRERRPASWQTAETTDPAAGLRQIPAPLLLDSLGSWLTGVLDRAQAWTQAPGWRDQVDAEMAALVQAYAQRPEPVVAVTDEVGWGVVPATAAGRLFRDLLGQLNQAVAGCSDQVVVVVAGQLMTSTGERP